METLERQISRWTALAPPLAALWSLAVGVLGLWWWLRPDAYPFGLDPANSSTVLDLMPGGLVAPALAVAGVVGVVVAFSARGARPGRLLLVVVALAYAVVFGLVVPGMAPVAMVGYVMAMFGPAVLFATLFAGAWRWRGGPVAVAVFVLVAASAWFTGIADGSVLARYAGVITGSIGKMVVPGTLLFLLVGGIVWALLAARLVLRERGAPAWTRPGSAARWGRVAAIVAALCALPYGLIRMTWLTPWPLGVGPADLAGAPEIRLHGLLLGLAALSGGLLTLGLISRWGEIWPRWMPVVRGRPVPIAAAVVPGALVAMLFTAAAVPFALASTSGELWMLFVFPFPVWGPALGIAVLGYALRRAGTIEGT